MVTFSVYAGLYGSFFYVPLYLQSTLGHSATIAGATFVPTTLLLFILSPYAGRLNDRYGPRWLMCFGPLGAAAGLLVMCFTGPGQLFTVMLPGMLLFGIGLGFTVTPVTATAIGVADERFGGIASGFNNAVSRVAGMMAIAMMGVIVVHLWQIGIDTASVDGGRGDRVPLRDGPRGVPGRRGRDRLRDLGARTAGGYRERHAHGPVRRDIRGVVRLRPLCPSSSATLTS